MPFLTIQLRSRQDQFSVSPCASWAFARGTACILAPPASTVRRIIWPHSGNRNVIGRIHRCNGAPIQARARPETAAAWGVSIALQRTSPDASSCLRGDPELMSAPGSAPRRRESPVEEESTQRVVIELVADERFGRVTGRVGAS
jgi:hypothetical protein